MLNFGKRALAPILLAAACGLVQAADDPHLAWTDVLDGGAQFTDDGFLCRLAPDGQPVVAGESTQPTGGVDLLVRKLDRDTGATRWQFRYEGYDDKDIAVTDMTWDSVGQLLVSGFIRGCVG